MALKGNGNWFAVYTWDSCHLALKRSTCAVVITIICLNRSTLPFYCCIYIYKTKKCIKTTINMRNMLQKSNRFKELLSMACSVKR